MVIRWWRYETYINVCAVCSAPVLYILYQWCINVDAKFENKKMFFKLELTRMGFFFWKLLSLYFMTRRSVYLWVWQKYNRHKKNEKLHERETHEERKRYMTMKIINENKRKKNFTHSQAHTNTNRQTLTTSETLYQS